MDAKGASVALSLFPISEGKRFHHLRNGHGEAEKWSLSLDVRTEHVPQSDGADHHVEATIAYVRTATKEKRRVK